MVQVQVPVEVEEIVEQVVYQEVEKVVERYQPFQRAGLAMRLSRDASSRSHDCKRRQVPYDVFEEVEVVQHQKRQQVRSPSPSR